ncbi:DUF924 family protein [Rhizobium hidalgonense]|uniref:DUF924 family protein n=1 Tax=Rhizobium hidalgonense TaxID=1538159 RepID=UPI0011075A28|nr:DUF924 family protein [Rhizobium hidalgonense]QKK23408.1 DUF924 domain-containing protein [Rhizobium hidalgonense]
MATIRTPREVYDFWFVRCGRELWFRPTPELDVEIRDGFRDTHLALAAGIGDEWRADAESRLAAIIVLDQFSRNIYRGTPLAFATDGLALREAKLALAAGADQAVETACRTFIYLPFEHAENPGEQEHSVELFTALGDAEYLDYAIRHRDVIAAYGRFPHRNVMLGRESTAVEREYLSKPGAGF